MTPLESVLLSFSLVCALTDTLEGKIYNVLTIPLLVGGLVYYALGLLILQFTMVAATQFGMYVSIGILCFLLAIVCYGIKIIAGGDVKFFVALYAWIGPSEFLMAMAYILMASGCLGLLYMLEDGRLKGWIESLYISFVSGKCVTTPDIDYRRPLGFSVFLGIWAYILLE